MTKTYNVTWSETVQYESTINLDVPDDISNDELEDLIYEHMYEGIICTDVPHGNENVQYSEV